MKKQGLTLVIITILSATSVSASKWLTRTPGEMSGGFRYFDLVVFSHGYPDGDNNGNDQDPVNPSTQDKKKMIL